MRERDVALEVVRWVDPELPRELDALISEAVGSGYAWASQFHETWLFRPFTREGEALLLAWREHRLLAMGAITADPYVDDPTTGRLRFIYVRQMARRQGIANRLVEDCLALAKGHWLAARLYGLHGFQPSGADPRATHTLTL
jgi:GNAT superfamily N-acetyltransferase